MCGIAGFFTASSHGFDEATIRGMLLPLEPRGPEGTSWMQVSHEGARVWKTVKDTKEGRPNLKMAMGCCRLAIQDLTTAGLQPIPNHDKSVWAIQNGEIFNFIELRQELEQLGYVFKTRTDTEIIAHAYSEWGVNCFSRFNGKFGMAIYDVNKEQLILARDRLGVTPLYFEKQNEGVFFASEIKSLLTVPSLKRKINHHRLAATIGLPYKLHWAGNDSLFDGIEQVKPGEYIVVNKGLSIERKPYWSIESIPEHHPKNFLEARNHLRELLIDSVKIRMRTDRRFGFIVSGGIDSPAVIGIASRLYGIEPETFSLDLPDERFNENDSIREVIAYNKVTSHFIPVTPDAILHALPTVERIADEPFPTPNGILHVILAKAISDRGIKVVLNGVGGDEAFFGYHDHFLHYLYDLEMTGSPRFKMELNAWQEKQGRPLSTYEQFRDFAQSDAAQFSPDFLARSKGFDYRECLKKDYRDEYLERRALFHSKDFFPRAKQIADMGRLTLPYALKMDDNCYMGHAVESRQPFLDYRLVEYGIGLPREYKIHNGISKFLLRAAVRDLVPATRRRDLKKIGLNLPIDVWMRGPLKPWLLDALASSDEPIYSIADRVVVEKVMKEHFDDQANHVLKLWDLACVNLWMRKHCASSVHST